MAKLAKLNTLVENIINELARSKANDITPEIITKILIDRKEISEDSFNSNVFSQVKTIIKELS